MEPKQPRLSNAEVLRYSRHLVMPEVTLEGQRKLKAGRVLVVGAGGLGSPLALYLAAAGVGTIGLVEFDDVDLTNLQRQVLYTSRDVGRPKIDAACERLRALNPEVTIVPHATRLARDNAMEIVRDYDVVADGTDNFATRYLVNDVCVLTNKINVYASIFRFEGQVSVFNAARGPCYRCLFPAPPPPGVVPSCAEGGVLGVLPGIVGSLQALEVLKIILGVGDSLVGRLVHFDALSFTVMEMRVRKDPDCPVCGDSLTITEPIDTEAFCGLRGEEPERDDDGFPTIAVEELHASMQAGQTPLVLDVREPHERAIASIPGAMSMPLGQIPARLHTLDPVGTITITCHRGARSAQAYRLLRAAGFERLQILEGGVDAWAMRVDPTMARY